MELASPKNVADTEGADRNGLEWRMARRPFPDSEVCVARLRLAVVGRCKRVNNGCSSGRLSELVLVGRGSRAARLRYQRGTALS
jgi:hypothetical protein